MSFTHEKTSWIYQKLKGFRMSGEMLLDVGVGFMFPFIMNYGFATCAGMFMLVPVEDRELKTH